MRRRLLFIEVEGDPPAGRTAPLFSLYHVLPKLERHLKGNTWHILCYGEQWFNEGETTYTVDARIDGSRSPEGRVGQEDTALRRGGGGQPVPPGLIDGDVGS